MVLKGWFGTNAAGDGDGRRRLAGARRRGRRSWRCPRPADSFQAEDAKKALDSNLKDGGAVRATRPGGIGALAYEVTLAPGETRTLDFGMAEVPPDGGRGRARAPRALRRSVRQPDAVLEARAAEARRALPRRRHRAPGPVRRGALVAAVGEVLLRLGRGRPRRRLEGQGRRPRRPDHARQVGVPLARVLGHRVPRRRGDAGRPGPRRRPAARSCSPTAGSSPTGTSRARSG